MFGIDDAIAAVAKVGGSLIDRLVPDTNAREAEKAAFDLEVQKELNAALSDQREINKVEAGSASIFVAGWRPAVGWLCVITLAYQWIFAPTVSWLFVATGHDLIPLPVLGKDDAQTLLYALLGIGSLRTIDKMGGNDTKGIAGAIMGAAKSLLPGRR